MSHIKPFATSQTLQVPTMYRSNKTDTPASLFRSEFMDRSVHRCFRLYNKSEVHINRLRLTQPVACKIVFLDTTIFRLIERRKLFVSSST